MIVKIEPKGYMSPKILAYIASRERERVKRRLQAAFKRRKSSI